MERQAWSACYPIGWPISGCYGACRCAHFSDAGKTDEPHKQDELPAFEGKAAVVGEQTLEKVLGYAPLGILLLFVPAWISVTRANALANHLYDSIESLMGLWLVGSTRFLSRSQPQWEETTEYLRCSLSTAIRAANDPDIYRINCHL